jgi:hypothetical protein
MFCEGVLGVLLSRSAMYLVGGRALVGRVWFSYFYKIDENSGTEKTAGINKDTCLHLPHIQ